MRRLLAVAAACLLLVGCARPVASQFTQARQPFCEVGGEPGTPFLVLMAQAVPSASQLPCVKVLPAGWSVSNTFVRDGRARFALAGRRRGEQKQMRKCPPVPGLTDHRASLMR